MKSTLALATAKLRITNNTAHTRSRSRGGIGEINLTFLNSPINYFVLTEILRKLQRR